jgi:FMN phosphatase YigB (HAD superfamily)
MRKQIFLDCDGVLADFDRGAESILGLPPGTFEQRHGSGEFWKRLARADDFFANLEPMPDAFELYEAVRHRNPVILTGLPRGRWAEPQKRRWAERHFPGVPVITTLAALKHEHRHPGDALVDDRDKHRHLWEKEGGIFIHHKSAAGSIAELKAHGYL